MLTVKSLTDLVMQSLLASYPEKAAALMPRESILVGVAEKILDECVVIPKDNWQTLETYHQWMRDMQNGIRELNDRTAIMCEAMNMMDVPRKPSELRGKGTGRRQRIRVVLEDEPEEPEPLYHEQTMPDGSVLHADSVEMFVKEERTRSKEDQQ